MKKFLSVLMSVIMVLSLFSILSVTSFAATSGDFEYAVHSDGKSCAVTKYLGSQTEVTVPSQINGYVVTEIGDAAFYEASIVSVTLPDTVAIIGKSAFEDCVNLEYFNIPSNLREIGAYAFFGCDELYCVAIPYTVTYIGERALGYSWYSVSDTQIQVVKYTDFVIIGYAGSAAESYALGSDFPFIEFNPDSNTAYMYRLYNPNSGEHFYTADIIEAAGIIIAGWDYEGIGWVAPKTSSTPTYRLYNQEGGEHHYTTDINERNWLVSLGWNDEGIGWYSDDAKTVPLYRQYNPNAFANNHNYTTDKAENDWLLSLGWQYEGIGWYGLA